MDKHYDITGAKSALEQLGTQTTDVDDRRLAAVIKDADSLSELRVKCFDGPTTWRIIRGDDNAEEEVIWVVRGIVKDKNMPPVDERPRSTARAGYLRQSVTLTGLGTPTFDMAVRGAREIYTLFDRSFPEGKLEHWGQSDGTGERDKQITSSNRYLIPRRDAPDAEHMKFTREVDPQGILESLAQAGFVHTEENEVLYFVRSKGAGGETFEPALPQVFRNGDIVEVQMAWVVIPLKAGKYKMISVLRSIALLDGTFTKDAKVRAGGEQIEGKKVPTLKRRIGYEQKVNVAGTGNKGMEVDE